ncbi:MAG: imidazole glycerol phosphate synthase subunit HisH [Clostridia bacterium]|nr:imidazole glycerol phosphate synthase subunit HisH [Clostridia bacterium]
MIAIVDYGVGNLFSLKSSFSAIGEEVTVTSDENVLRNADKIVLPGVGAFEDAAKKLKSSGLDQVIVSLALSGKPLLGICLGMQMLFDESYEYGCHKGLGLIPGKVVPMEGVIPAELKIPHIGWNALKMNQDCEITKYIKEGDFVYFVHSYYADCDEKYKVAVSEYGKDLTAIVKKDNVFGCQFHPEKSGEVGLNILRAFSREV